ncbi:MAG: hypothetical protein ACQERR_05145 [Pseudomonadota bacterium]
MYRLWDLPTYRTMETGMALERFHCLRLFLLRAGEPRILDLRGLRSLGLLLEDEAWVCIDRTMNDLPVAAWTHFRRPASLAPGEQVTCQLHHYHSHASLIVNSILEKAESEVMRRSRRTAPGRAAILPFPGQ